MPSSYAYDANLQLIENENGAVLYDVNRVKTYACSPSEANYIKQEGLQNNRRGAMPKGAAERLNRLSDLSRSLTETKRTEADSNAHISYLLLNLCETCNLKCAYCYAKTRSVPDASSSMSAEAACKSIDFLMRHAPSGGHCRIAFAGGEPFLNYDTLCASVIHARRQSQRLGLSLSLKILTNGTIMRPEILKFITEHGIGLQISMDGPPAIQDRLRPMACGQGSSEKVQDTIAYLKKRNYDDFRLRSTCSHVNSDLSQIASYFEDKTWPRFTFRPVMTDDRHPLRLRSSDLPNMKSYYKATTVKITNGQSSLSDLQVPEDLAIFVARLGLGLKTKYYCGAGRDMVVVDPAGHLYPCPAVTGDAHYTWGDLDVQDMTSLNPIFPNLSVDQKEFCDRCWARNLCGGGCTTQALQKNHDPYHPDELECELLRVKIACAILIHAHRNAYM